MNLFKNDKYFNQSVMNDETFKGYYTKLTSGFDMEKIGESISKIVCNTDECYFLQSDNDYKIKVENHDFPKYQNIVLPAEERNGYIKVEVQNRKNVSTLIVEYFEAVHEISVTRYTDDVIYDLQGYEKNGNIAIITNSEFPPYTKKRTLKK